MHTEKQNLDTSQEGETPETSHQENHSYFSEITQCKFPDPGVVQKAEYKETNEKKPNRTGMPDRLKSGLENLSGYDLSPVRVHYNSPKPKQIGALAYTQGTNIHIGPGQQKHLPHEGWHAVQQMQGRVRPTIQKKGMAINDEVHLEHEADLMGVKAAHYSGLSVRSGDKTALNQPSIPVNTDSGFVAQCETKTWNAKLGIKSLDSSVSQETVDVEYDTETGLTVSEIRAMFKSYNSKSYQVKIVFTGTNAQLNNNLQNPDFVITGDRIRLNGGSLLIVLVEHETVEEAEEAEVQMVSRPAGLIKKADLQTIISDYEFSKVVTGNHIDSAKEKNKALSLSVKEQQKDQVSGKTLFIDPLFLAAGNESQYHDILVKGGGSVVSSDDYPLQIVQSGDGSVYIGILSCGLYTDELDEIDEVTVKHYINETRPSNVIAE